MSYQQQLRNPRERNIQNEHMQHCTVLVGDAVDKLVEHGFTILSITIRDSKPVIAIHACRLCSAFQGQYHRITATPGGKLYTFQADYHGCQVQWQTDQPPTSNTTGE